MACQNALKSPLLAALLLTLTVFSAAGDAGPAAAAASADDVVAAVATGESAGPLAGEGSAGGSVEAADGNLSLYAGEPLWQDLRLLTSFALGILCMQVVEMLKAGQGDGEVDEPRPRGKFEMYPFAL